MKELAKLGFMKLFLLEKGDKFEELVFEETCYILSGSGLFILKVNDLYRSLAKCEVPNSIAMKPFMDYSKLPKIPKIYMNQAICFFKKIYDLHKTEAALILYWNRTEFKWSCPEQKVSGASVNYTEDHPGEGWMTLLHMHSHASMSAFHSGTDDKDEMHVDGYNITIGKLNDVFEFECRVMIGKAQTKCNMEDIVENWIEQADFPNEWLNKVNAPSNKVYINFPGQQSLLLDGLSGIVSKTPVFSPNTYDGIFLTKEYGGKF